MPLNLNIGTAATTPYLNINTIMLEYLELSEYLRNDIEQFKLAELKTQSPALFNDLVASGFLMSLEKHVSTTVTTDDSVNIQKAVRGIDKTILWLDKGKIIINQAFASYKKVVWHAEPNPDKQIKIIDGPIFPTDDKGARRELSDHIEAVISSINSGEGGDASDDPGERRYLAIELEKLGKQFNRPSSNIRDVLLKENGPMTRENIDRNTKTIQDAVTALSTLFTDTVRAFKKLRKVGERKNLSSGDMLFVRRTQATITGLISLSISTIRYITKYCTAELQKKTGAQATD